MIKSVRARRFVSIASLLRNRFRAAAIAAVLLGTVSGKAQTTYTWNGASTNLWATPANWGGTAPVAGDTANLTGFGNFTTIDMTGAAAQGKVAFNAAALSYTLSTASLLLDNGAGIAEIQIAGGAGLQTITGGVTLASTSNGQLLFTNNGAAFAPSLSVSTGAITKTSGAAAGGGLAFDGNGWTSIASVIGSATANLNFTGGLTKTGAGTLTLTGVNLFTGTVAVNGGLLSINNDSALGVSTNAVTLGGGNLSTSGTVTSARAYAVNSATTIDTGANTFTISGAVTGTGDLTKSGSGTLTLSNANTGGLSGAVNINRGSLTLTTLTGALPAVTSIVIRGGGTLNPVNGTSLGNNNRLNDNLVLSLLGGNYLAGGTSTVNTTETIGQVQFNAGDNRIAITSSGGTGGGAGLIFTNASGLARSNGATALLAGSSLGQGTAVGVSNAYIYTTLATAQGLMAGSTTAYTGTGTLTTVGVVPFFTAATSGTATAGTTLVGYNSATGSYFTLLAANYDTSATLVSGTNAQPTAATVTVGSTVSVNSFSSATTTQAVNIGAGQSLSIASGALLYTASSTLTFGATGSLVFGSVGTPLEAVATVASSTGSVVLNAPVTAIAFTKAGLGNVTLGTDNTSTLVGPITVNNGTLTVAADNALGAPANIVRINGTIINAAALLANGTFSSNRTINIGGEGSVNVASGQTLTLAGTVGDSVAASPGALVKIGSGTLALNATASFTGSTPLSNSGISVNVLIGSGSATTEGGTLALTGNTLSSKSVGIGQGILNVTGATTVGNLVFANTAGTGLQTLRGVFGTGTLTVASNEIRVVGNSTGFGNTFAAGLALPADTTLYVGSGSNANSELVISGVISGAGKLNYLSGVSSVATTSAGGITLSGNNTFSGGFTLNNPSTSGVLFNTDTAFGTGIVTLNTGTLTAGAGNRTLANNVAMTGALATIATGTFNVTFNGNWDLNASSGPVTRTLTGTGTGIITLAGVVSRSGTGVTGLTFTGGTYALANANTYDGLTTIAGGIVSANASGAIPGAVTLNGGTLLFGNNAGVATPNITVASASTIGSTGIPRTVANNLVFNAATATTLSLASSPVLDLTVGGAVDLNNTPTAALVRTFSVPNGQTLTLSGVIGNSNAAAGLTKGGAGTLVLNGTVPNTYGGTTAVTTGVLAANAAGAVPGAATVSGGTLQANAAGAVAGALSLSSGTLLFGDNAGVAGGITFSGTIGSVGSLGASRTIANAVAFSSTSGTTITLSSTPVLDLTLTGAIDLNNTATTSLVRTFSVPTGQILTLSGVIGNSNAAAGLTKSGNGILVLSGANTYSGTTSLTGGGTLVLSGGNSSTGLTSIGTGMLQFTSDSNFASGTITLAGGTLQPLTSGTFGRDLAHGTSSTIDVGSQNPTFSGSISGSGATLTKAGAGTLTLVGANTYSGAIALTAGGLTFKDTGTAANAGTTTVSGGATFTLDNSGTVNSTDRIANTSGVTLNTGNFLFIGAAGGASSEALGALAITAGANVLTVNPNGGTGSTVTFSSYSRTAGTVLFRGTNLGTAGAAQILLTGQTVGSVLPGALYDASPTGSGTGPAVYTATGVAGSFSYNQTNGAIQNPSNGGTTATTANVLIQNPGAAVPTVGTPNTINSLTFDGNTSNAAVSVSTGTLNVASGALIVNAGTTGASVTGGALSFGAAGLAVYANANLALGSNLSSTAGGLTKFFGGTLSLTGTYGLVGAVAVNAGTVDYNPTTPAALATGTGGTVSVAAGTSLTLNNNALNAGTNALTVAGTLNTGGGGVTAGTISGNGTINLGATGALSFTQASDVVYTGTIAGGTTFAKAGANKFTYSGAPLAYTGSTAISLGTLAVTAANALPSTTVLTVGAAAGAANVTFDMSAAGANQAFAGLVLQPGTSSGNTFVQLGANTLTLSGDINYSPAGTGSLYPAQLVGGTLNLGGAVRNVTVNANINSSGDLVISSAITNGGINYAGTPTSGASAAVLSLGGASTYAGDTTINRGNLRTSAAGALSPNSKVILANNTTGQNATLDLNAFNQVIAGLATASTVIAANNIVTSSSAATLTINGSSSNTFAGVITGSLSLVKSGSGTQTLSGANTYTGATTINGGVLSLTGSLLSASTVNVNATGTFSVGSSSALASAIINVNNGGTFTVASGVTLAATNTVNYAAGAIVRGTGTIAGNLSAAGAIVRPGASPGVLTIGGNTSMDAASTFSVEIAGATPGNGPGFHSQLTVNGTVTLGSANLEIFTLTYAPVQGVDSFLILNKTSAGAISGTFNNLPEGAPVTLGTFNSTLYTATISYIGGNGNDIVLTPVPEPAGLLALGGAAFGLLSLRRRRKA